METKDNQEQKHVVTEETELDKAMADFMDRDFEPSICCGNPEAVDLVDDLWDVAYGLCSVQRLLRAMATEISNLKAGMKALKNEVGDKLPNSKSAVTIRRTIEHLETRKERKQPLRPGKSLTDVEV